MDERSLLCKDLKNNLRNLQNSLKYTEKQLERDLSAIATSEKKEALKKCRGNGTVLGLINYLNYLEDRLNQVSLKDIENAATASPTTDIEKTMHLRFGETTHAFHEHGSFHVLAWLEMGANIEEWLTYALSAERINLYAKTKEYFVKFKASRKLFNSINSKHSSMGLTGHSKIIKKIEQAKELIKNQNALMLELVKDRKKELLDYLSIFFIEGLNFDDHHSLKLLIVKIEETWRKIEKRNYTEYQKVYAIQELNNNEIEEIIKQGINNLKSIPIFQEIENLDEQVRTLINKDTKNKKYYEAFFQILMLSSNDPILFKKRFFPNMRIRRNNISSNVKREVWRRDMGRCSKCGSREKLEYDHIIPVSKGGSNTSRNIELLCQSCNRKKAAQIS